MSKNSDITSMNDEQKMDFYIDEMGKEGEETPDASKPVDKGAPVVFKKVGAYLNT